MIRVLIVDDSVVVRRIFAQRLNADPELTVIGTAPDPYVARDLIVQEKPDVVVLDIEMPRMDGISFLRRLMRYYPLPVVIVSSLAPKDGAIALEALDAGAVEVMCKSGGPDSVGDIADELCLRVKAAAHAVLPSPLRVRTDRSQPELPSTATSVPTLENRAPSGRIIALGASTGGPHAVELIIRRFPADCPPTVVVMHMPELFTKSFAKRLDGSCAPRVSAAAAAEELQVGSVLVAPGGTHLLVTRGRSACEVRLKQGPRVNHHRPSVDVLFMSLAKAAGSDACAALLTGMGNDGAKGLLKIRQAGGRTVVQDEQTSTVFGMPRAALELGAADQALPAGECAEWLLSD